MGREKIIENIFKVLNSPNITLKDKRYLSSCISNLSESDETLNSLETQKNVIWEGFMGIVQNNIENKAWDSQEQLYEILGNILFLKGYLEGIKFSQSSNFETIYKILIGAGAKLLQLAKLDSLCAEVPL